MAEETKHESSEEESEFASQAASKSSGLIREYVDMIRYHGKWWLVPPIAALLLFGILLVLGGTSLAPVIYALF